jgi:hypothetical protein
MVSKSRFSGSASDRKRVTQTRHQCSVVCPASGTRGSERACSGNRHPGAVAYQLPPDYVIVALAGVILAGTAFMLRSLGDVVGDESRLPPASGAKARRELYGNRRYLQRKPPGNPK